MKIPSFALIFVISIISFSLHAKDNPWVMDGKVIYVPDGDTLTLLLLDQSKVSIRLSDIDAPETSHGHKKPGQPFSQASKKSLTDLAKGKNAQAHCFEIDSYKRPVCRVLVDGVNVNAEQLLRGMAWANAASRRYVRDPHSFEYESRAKAAGLGLWSLNERSPVPPWVWRRDCWKLNHCH